jgi:hypothetical protein
MTLGSRWSRLDPGVRLTSVERTIMDEPLETAHLSHHHRETLQRVFQHPVSHNLEWRDVLSLLEAVGTVELRHDDRYHVVVGEQSQVLMRPKNKDLDVEVIMELRRLFKAAGYEPDAP